MAYMSQENKKSKSPKIKDVLKKYGVKGTLAVRHYSTLVLNINSGKIDFIKNYNETSCNGTNFRPVEGHIDVNEYHIKDYFTGEAQDCLKEVITIMNEGNSDYYDVGWYVDINIGQWDKPYTLES